MSLTLAEKEIISYRVNALALKITTQSEKSPINGIIESIKIDPPAGVSAVVELFVMQGPKTILPLNRRGITFSGENPVELPICKPVEEEDLLSIRCKNHSTATDYIISAQLVLIEAKEHVYEILKKQ